MTGLLLKQVRKSQCVVLNKNIVGFLFLCILTERNNSLRIETVLNLPIGIELTSTISAYCEPADLGNRIIKMFRSEITERK